MAAWTKDSAAVAGIGIGEVVGGVLGRLGGIDSDNFDSAIEASLGDVGREVGADRVMAVVFADMGQERGGSAPAARHAYQWKADGKGGDAKAGIEDVAMARAIVELMSRELRPGALVVNKLADDWPVELADWRAHLEREGIKSMVAMPVRGKQCAVSGVLVVQCLREAHAWSEEEQRWLKVTGAIVGCEMENRRAHAQLLDRERLLHSVNAGLPGITFQFFARDDGGMGFHYVSPKWDDMFEPLETWHLGKHVHADDRQAMLDAVHVSLRDLSPFEFEGRYIWRDGEVHWFELLAIPLRRGSEIICNGVGLDITERKKAEQALRAARDEADAANRAKDYLLAAVSHELRTPLTPILLISTSLERDESMPAEVRRDMAEIREHVEMEKRLIADLLDFTAMRAGRVPVRRRGRASVHEALRAAIDVCAGEAERKGIDLEVKLTAARDTIESGDADRLRQIFWNVLQNAVKFTPRNGWISVSTVDEPGGKIRVEIEDNGVGMDAAALARLFVPFEQGAAPDETHQHHGGLGLGLAIAKGLIDAHGGTITATSEGPGAGTTFTIVFPEAGIAAAPPALAAAQEVPRAPGALHLLLVEDHGPTLRLMEEVLTAEGYVVYPARTKAEALHTAQHEKIDLIVCDIGLPDGSGLEVMRTLRDRPPIVGVAVSGYGTAKDLEASRRAGFVEHLVKPVDLGTLRAAIAKASRQVQR